MKINDTEELSVRLIEGDEETEYLAKQVTQMVTRRVNLNKGRHGGRGGGGGRYHNRKRHASHDTSDTPNKKNK